MILIANGLVALVATLHVYFLALEMFLWTKPLGLKTFRNSIEKARETAVLAANQGLYNGVPDQDILPALRDRGRRLWRCDRQPQDSLGAGSARRCRADFALVGVASSILQCQICSSNIRANDGNRRRRKDRRTRPLAQSPMRKPAI
jgi:hypothetical protein